MASTFNPLLPLFLAYLVSTTATARPLASNSTLATHLNLYDNNNSSNNNKKELGSAHCWGSVLELQSCTGELILFFLNGGTSLGPACCGAIRAIQHDCLPTLLGSLGFTPEEGDILLGYCDASASPAHPSGNSTKMVGSYVVVP